MKIIISEAQNQMLTRLSEASVDIKPFLANMDIVIKELDRLYNIITFSTIADIISGNINLKKYSDELVALEDKGRNFYQLGYFELDKVPDDEYNKLGLSYDAELDDKVKAINDKVKVLIPLIDELKERIDGLPEIADKGDWTESFEDIEGIEI